MFAAAAKRTALAAVSIVLLGALSIAGAAAGESPKKSDPVAPSTPTNLHVVGATPSAVSIAWDPAQDAVGVAGYYVWGDRGKATVVDPNYIIDGRQCNESIDISVQAFDDAGNRSERAQATVSTAACPDTQPPSVPTGFVQQATTQNAVVLAWPASTDNVGVVGYGVYRDLTKIASPADPTVTLSGLACGSSTPYKVDAVDAAGIRSALGTAFVQTTACADSQPPTAPTNLALMAKTTSSLSLGWSPSTDNVGVAGYHVSAGGSPVATVTQPGAMLTGLACGTTYSISVDAFDEAGNRSPSSSTKGSTDACAAPDSMAPSVPTGLAASNVSQTGLTLTWNASSDNIGVTGYDVYKGGTKVGTVSSTSSTLGSLACGTAYTLGVAARDAAGNTSQQAQLTVSTASCPSPSLPADTTPPSQPTNLSIWNASSTSVTLSWSASTDNVGVTGYRTYVNGALAVTVVAPGAVVSGLSCGTAYAIDVEAVDAAGNRSSLASIVGTTTACPDTQAPTTPTSVVASSRTATSIALTWAASTDNVGVAGYRLYRGGSSVGTTSSTTGIFSGLACNTNYTLGVDAYDAAGNHSAQTVVMVSTAACPDTTPPSTPTGLATSNVTLTGLTLTWNASNDNVGVAGYDLYQSGTKMGSTSGTTYTLASLSCGTSYTLGIIAYDAAGNRSSAANQTASTSACSTPTGNTCTSPQTISVSSTYTVTGTVSCKKFVAAAGFSGNVVQIQDGAKLADSEVVGSGGNQCVVGGVVSNVTASNCGAGFIGVQQFLGLNYAHHNFDGFYLSGNGVTQPADGVMRAEYNTHAGVWVVGLLSSNFQGLIDTSHNQDSFGAATGFEIAARATDNHFAHNIANDNSGYGVAIANFDGVLGSVARNSFDLIEINGAADPGTTITGGVQTTRITREVIRNATFGVTVGEDNPTVNSGNWIGSLEVYSAPWGCVRVEASDGFQIDSLVCSDTGSADPNLSDASVFLRSTALNTTITNLSQSGLAQIPMYAVHCASGASGSSSGKASSWSTAKVQNQSTACNISV